ncbi:membrane protein [Klebsiella michiganensis]|uniref:Membrane protein n=1 Tax=Klebsiella michiganensis TaxID=1134687 RepID=A0A7H4LX69_9ENTR|nr:membrane protein [Klebsiella michiganensis]
MTAGTLLGLVMAIRMTHETAAQPLQEARRLLDSVGWAFILPQILAVLGLLFTAAGVGNSISLLTQHYLAVDSRFIAVAVYTLGMALLTMVMGNAFAAFPIVTAGVGIPILVLQHGGEPGGDGGHWHVLRLLRYPDDAHGGELQYRACRAAGAAG